MLLFQAAPFHLSEKKGVIRLGHRNVATGFIRLKQCCPQGAGKRGQRGGPGCTSAVVPRKGCSIKTSFNCTLLTDTDVIKDGLVLGTGTCWHSHLVPRVLATNHSHSSLEERTSDRCVVTSLYSSQTWDLLLRKRRTLTRCFLESCNCLPTHYNTHRPWHVHVHRKSQPPWNLNTFLRKWVETL